MFEASAIGIVGCVVLALGAALPDRSLPHAWLSLKNWCFAAGAVVMLVYAVVNYFAAGAPVFFVFLETLMVVSSVLMLIDVPERIDIPIILVLSAVLIAWSLFLFHEHQTIFFVLGLAAIAIGYVAKSGTVHREAALLIGSVLILLFSYWTAAWLFFWLNVFFALFSGLHVWKAAQKPVLPAKNR